MVQNSSGEPLSAPQVQGDEQVYTLASKFYVPKSTFIIILTFLAIIIPEAMGLSFARYGATWDGKRVHADVFLSHLNFSEYLFFFVGFATAFLCVLFFILTLFYSKIGAFKYITIAIFALLNYLIGMAYTRINFQAPVYANYHHIEAYKVNAINVGIISVLFALALLVVTVLVLLILRKKFPNITKIYTKRNCLIYYIVLSMLMVALVYLTPVLEYFSATSGNVV